MALEAIGIISALLLLILAVAYRYLTSTFSFFEKQGIQGPKPTIIAGNWWGLWNKFIGEEDLNNVRQYGKIYGTFDGRTPNLIVTDPDLAKAVLVKEAANFRSRRASTVKGLFLQKSLLVLEGKESKETQDEIVAVSHDKLKRLVPRILKATETLTQGVKKTADDAEGKIVISNHTADFISNALATAVFGLESNSSEKGIDLQQFSAFLSQAFLNDNPDSPMALLPFIYPSLTPLDTFVLRNNAAKYFISLSLSTIEERSKADKPTENRVPDLVDLLLEAMEEERRLAKDEGKEIENSSLLTRDVLVAQCLAVLLNASLLARSAISLSVSTLAAKPEIQEKLHSELNKQLQSSSEVSFDLVQNSQYLTMFIGEILRIYPYEFRLEQECIKTTELEKLKIEKGTIVSIPLYALHHLEEFYSEPENFDPERFSPANAEKRDPFTYLPFGQAGNNGANISVQLGVLIAQIALATLVKKFKFAPSDETKIPPSFEKGITGVLRPEPITVTAEARK